MAAPPIKLKRSGTTTATPSSLEYGELAINYADGALFYRDSSDVIQSFTLQAYALSSHTHAASDITSGTLDAARLPLATTGAVGGVIVGTGLGVSSGTVSVTYGTTSGTACQGNDSRLSDARTPTDGSVTTAKIANDAVTYAKLQNVSTTDRLLGRSSAGSGDVEEVTCTAFGRSLIDDADAAAARTTLGVQPTASPAFTGAATVTNDGNVVPLTVTNTGTANSFVVNDASGDTSPFVINASGDVAIGTSSPSAKLDVHGTIRCGAGSTDPGTGAVMYLVGSGFFQTVIAGAAFGVHTGGNNARTERFFISGSGVSTFSGQLLVTAGSASACGVAFSGDPDTGIAQLGGADTLSFVTNEAERLQINADGNAIFTRPGEYALVMRRTDTGVTNNFISAIAYDAKNASGTYHSYCRLITQQTDATAGTESGQFYLQVRNNGTERSYVLIDGESDTVKLLTGGSERVLIDASGNIRINGAAAATSAVGAIHLKNGTAPTASITDGVVLFAADVTTSELRVRDEAGNTTTLSPHAFPLIPEGPSEPMAWAYYSERDGRRINVDMLRVVRLLEQLTGEKLVYED